MSWGRSQRGCLEGCVFERGRKRLTGYIGLVGGLAVGSFSKTLASLFGMIVVGLQVSFLSEDAEMGADWEIQFLASRGFNILPTARIQKYVKGIDLRSAVEDNVAFKLSFGLTFALASLAEF